MYVCIIMCVRMRCVGGKRENNPLGVSGSIEVIAVKQAHLGVSG